MKRFGTWFTRQTRRVSQAIFRFPFTVLCLTLMAALLFYLISLDFSPPLWVEKSTFALSVGALLGMLTQFALERFALKAKWKAGLYAAALLLTLAYFALLWPAQELENVIVVRTLVTVFALLCAVLWLPAVRGGTDFNKLSLIHFKSFFTSLLYSGVLFAGIAAILFAVDRLLFSISSDSYAYAAVLVWVLFAPLYYLSQLPSLRQNPEGEPDAVMEKEHYTRFLEVLISYIAIPLFTAYTLVLLAYIIKIIITRVWPIGLLGPMVLIYSAVGIVLFVLASLPENRSAVLFRRIFPKVWIPIVIMQMISVWIRLNAYGITESRYYVALFAVFSLISAVILSLRPVKANQTIALLAALFAIFSIVPPVDAFTLSLNSQTNRLERYLTEAEILSDGELTPQPEASIKTKQEVTNILNYLEYNHSLSHLTWLPKDFNVWEDMRDTFGFEPTWGSPGGENATYYNVSLDTTIPLDIAGYDTAVQINSYRYAKPEPSVDTDTVTYAFTGKGKAYTLVVERTSGFDVSVSLLDANSQVLIASKLYPYFEELLERAPSGGVQSPEDLSFTEIQGGAQLKVIFQNVNATIGGSEAGADYFATILVKVP